MHAPSKQQQYRACSCIAGHVSLCGYCKPLKTSPLGPAQHVDVMVQRPLNVQRASLQPTVWRGRWLRHSVRGANATMPYSFPTREPTAGSLQGAIKLVAASQLPW